MLPLRTLQELDRAVEEDRAVPPLLEWHKHPQDHSSLDGGAISFHSLRNYWQERLDEDDEEDNEVTSCCQIVYKKVIQDRETVTALTINLHLLLGRYSYLMY